MSVFSSYSLGESPQLPLYTPSSNTTTVPPPPYKASASTSLSSHPITPSSPRPSPISRSPLPEPDLDLLSTPPPTYKRTPSRLIIPQSSHQNIAKIQTSDFQSPPPPLYTSQSSSSARTTSTSTFTELYGTSSPVEEKLECYCLPSFWRTIPSDERERNRSRNSETWRAWNTQFVYSVF